MHLIGHADFSGWNFSAWSAPLPSVACDGEKRSRMMDLVFRGLIARIVLT